MNKIRLRHKSLLNKSIICESDDVDLNEYRFVWYGYILEVKKLDDGIIATNGTSFVKYGAWNYETRK